MHRELPPQPDKRTTRTLKRGIVAGVMTLAFAAGMGAPVAQADTLDDRRAVLNQELASQAEAVEHASAEAAAALSAYNAAQDELADAQAALARAESATEAARELDATRATQLADADHKVVQAEADVAAAQAAYDSVDNRTTEEITVITQQSGPLVELALIFGELESADLNQRAQLATTLFDSSSLELDELTSRQFTLDNAKLAADDARAAAQKAREDAAAALSDTEAKEEAADVLRDKVAAKVALRDAAKADASAQLATEESRQAALEAESVQVDQRIAQRIAQEEARRKAAEEAARQKAIRDAAAKKAADEAAQRQAAAEAAAARAANKPVAKPAKPATKPATKTVSKPATSTTTTSSTGFMRPVNGRLSSPYGMRLHPVLGYRKLHDGTDFAAPCGTPMKAAYAGVVSDKYFNAGYGNRLMIDHGRIDGSYVTTGYNHATRYVVSVGQRVAKGQVIGYVGTTGYSTGCHLHLMVWQDGATVNPMAKWFD